jgi:hypothetical protein
MALGRQSPNLSDISPFFIKLGIAIITRKWYYNAGGKK